MNALVRQTEFAPPDALSEPRRHRFTLDDLLIIQATGILGDGRNELVDGEIIDMPSDGDLHRSWTRHLTIWLAGRLDPERIAFLPNATLDASVGWAPSPDFYLYPAELEEGAVKTDDVLLAIELADTSLAGDLGDKALRYARHDVRDYWVIDLNARRLHVHRDPTPDGYRSVATYERDQPVDALLIPGLTLRLADLPRVG